jgi:pimeloyl-ACP methyl ester carboxylesterase
MTGETVYMQSETRYAMSGDVSIAYQVIGDGSIDIVFVHGFVSHLEVQAENPRDGAFFERLAEPGRVIRFDRRGTGLSDRPREVPTLEAHMDDVRAVMDAAGSPRAVIVATFEAAAMAMVYAATYPERVAGLVVYCPIAKGVRSPDYLPFDDASFDVVTGFNSFQYAADPSASLREARRVLHDSGRVLMAVWGRPDQCDGEIVLDAVRALLPPPPPGASGPLALSEDGALAELLDAAGFEQLIVADVSTPLEYSSESNYVRAWASAGPCVTAARLAGQETLDKAILAAQGRFPPGRTSGSTEPLSCGLRVGACVRAGKASMLRSTHVPAFILLAASALLGHTRPPDPTN